MNEERMKMFNELYKTDFKTEEQIKSYMSTREYCETSVRGKVERLITFLECALNFYGNPLTYEEKKKRIKKESKIFYTKGIIFYRDGKVLVDENRLIKEINLMYSLYDNGNYRKYADLIKLF